MTDLSDGLAGFIHFPDQLKDLGEAPELIRGPAARHQDAVVVLCFHLVKGKV